ncbi:CapK protein, putative [Minicystis rosea]|nr:CapK protein, putative [Minicystis rosea]
MWQSRTPFERTVDIQDNGNMQGAGHVLDLRFSSDDEVSADLWRRAKEPFTTVVVWSLRDGAPTVASWATRGAGAVSDAELASGLIHRGFAGTKKRSSLVMALHDLAHGEGRDVRVLDLSGTLRDLRARLGQMERLLFSQERSLVLVVRGEGAPYARARRVLRAWSSKRGTAFTRAAGVKPGLCSNLLWRVEREEIIVLHRCTHERFGVPHAPPVAPTARIAEAGAAMGLDHPPGHDFVEQRIAETFERARRTVPVFRDAQSFDGLSVATPEAWAARFWDTTSIPADQRALGDRPDLRVSASSGTSIGAQRAHVVEDAVAADRYAAETSLWERVNPWRVAIVNRPTNLFPVDIFYDRYRSKRQAKDLRATPGANPTDIREHRWKRLAGAIAAYNPTALAGDAQYLVGLSQHLSKSDLPALRQLILSNHASWSFQKRDLGQCFGVEPTALYHAGETATIAVSCRHQRWHLLETHAHYEVFARGRPVGPGERGLLVATMFDSHVRPLLRYALGDIVTLSEQACPCGRPGRTVSLEGRAAFSFRDGRGQWVTPRQVDTALLPTRGVHHLSVRRETSGVVLEMIGTPDAVVPAGALADMLGLPVRVERASVLPLAARGGKLTLFSVPAGESLSEDAFVRADAPAIDYAPAAS